MSQPNLQVNLELPADDPLWQPLLAALAARGLGHPALVQPVTLRLTAAVYAPGGPLQAWMAEQLAPAWPTAQVARVRRVPAPEEGTADPPALPPAVPS